MKNIEKYCDELLNLEGDINCYFTECIMKEECGNKKDCDECKKDLIKWLNEEYKEPIKLTQFEYDLLMVHMSAPFDDEDEMKDTKLSSSYIIEGMKEEGYFKDIDLEMTLKEVLEKCEVIEEEHKKPVTLSVDEKAILRNLPEEFEYIVRNRDNSLDIYAEKPTKNDFMWADSHLSVVPFNLYTHLFQFVKWEDNEPYSIEELLKEDTYESSR